jgi:hypothetical protein
MQGPLHRGLFDPRSLSSGARELTQASTQDEVNLVSGASGSHRPNGQDTGWTPVTTRRPREGAGGGPPRPEAHWDSIGVVGLDGGRRTMMNWPREAPIGAAKNGDAGDKLGRPASITVQGR